MHPTQVHWGTAEGWDWACTAAADLHALAWDGEHGNVGDDNQVAGEDQLVAGARLLDLLVAQHHLHRPRQAARRHLPHAAAWIRMLGRVSSRMVWPDDMPPLGALIL